MRRENGEEIRKKLGFYLKLKKELKMLRIIALEVAFLLILRWVLGFKNNSIITPKCIIITVSILCNDEKEN